MAAEAATSKLAVESSPGLPLRARLALPPSTSEETRALRRVAGLAPPGRAREAAPVGLDGEPGTEPPGQAGPRQPMGREGEDAQADGSRPRRATPARLGLQATPGNELESAGRAMPPCVLSRPRRSVRRGLGNPSASCSRLDRQLAVACWPSSARRINRLLPGQEGVLGGLPAGGRLYSASMGPESVFGSNSSHRFPALRKRGVASSRNEAREQRNQNETLLNGRESSCCCWRLKAGLEAGGCCWPCAAGLGRC